MSGTTRVPGGGRIRELAEILESRAWTLAAAESCTGGLVAARITDRPGASAYFVGAVVAYANTVKQSTLDVPGSILERQGAVSVDCARAMAEGVRRALGADVGLATTGIAGPDGATPEKPVGLVYVACACPDGTDEVRELRLGGTRAEIRSAAVEAVLELALEVLQSCGR